MKVKLILFLISMNLVVNGQNEILGIAKEKKSQSYYKEQIELWKDHLNKNKKDGNAWIQYYRANRAYNQLKYADEWVNNQEFIFSKLEPIIEDLSRVLPNSFELYYIKSENTNDKYQNEFVDKAYAIDPNREEIYGPLLIKYYYLKNERALEELSKKMLDSNMYSGANLAWNYNALITSKPNSVFFANGDMDTMPKWILQYGKNLRRDVIIINKWILATHKAYRSDIYEQLNIRAFDKEKVNYESTMEYADALLMHIVENYKGKIYFQCGTDIEFFKKNNIEKDIYLVGLAYEYSKTPLDNEQMVLENLNNNYMMDNIVQDFQHHPDNEIVQKYMNLTYLPSLAKAYHYYQRNQDDEMKNHYLNLMKTIGENSGRMDLVNKYVAK